MKINFEEYEMGRKIIILEELDFVWDEEKIEQVVQAWNSGKSLKEINNIVKRQGAEVLILLIHLTRQKKIKKREGWIWGVNYKM